MEETKPQNPEIVSRLGFFKRPTNLLFILAAVLVISGGSFYGYQKLFKASAVQAITNPHVAFLDEVFETIKTNYWEDVADESLVNLYMVAIEKASEQKFPDPPKTRPDLNKFLEEFLAKYDDAKKTEISSVVADLVLANLQPFARSRLYTAKQQQDLQNNLNNITDTDQYNVLGVNKESSREEIEQAYKKELAQAKTDQSAEGRKKQEAIEHAYSTLADDQSRQKYDEVKVEPTLEGRLITPEIFYLKMSKFSPTMLEELVSVTKKFDHGERLDTLIFDLRDNVGGLIDRLPYILGPFIGPDQYAYQFFRKGTKEDFKTKTGWLETLIRYKKVIILINENTQSSGEVMAATLKKYNVGILVGTKTRGWGTVERVYELKNQPDPSQKFSAFIVNNVTLREDGQPIEGRGVDPLIDISKSGWDKELLKYHRYPPLVEAVRNLVKK